MTRSGGSARVLVVEDDAAIQEALVGSLGDAGYEVRGLPDGRDLEAELDRFRPDLVVLDWMLPGRDGPTLSRVVRSRTPAAVIIVTARDEVDDRLRGFDAGADDYVVKPFATSELLARTRAVLRRAGVTLGTIQVDDLLVDPAAARVTRGGVEVELTATELRLLVFLAENRDRVVSTLQILTQVWGYDDYADNLVQVHISALRRKIEAHGPRLIHTSRGLGYVLRAPR
ncbi:response regulator transcription factor [Microlunatus flavus]|uniref:response regulator transcription factor n=1 Tax=Microlunatus flavus TaxID=1036181 RepID=UPI000B85D7A7|nr:response regulator transcription factor [Microlunatus flavus]